MWHKLTNIFFILAIVSISVLLILFAVSFYFKNIYSDSGEEGTNNRKEEILKINPEMKILVLNSTKAPGIAKEMKLFLNTFEFKGVNIGNDSSSYRDSRILTKGNRIEQGRLLAKIIHINESLVSKVSSLDSSDIDCILILGEDYKLLKPFRK